MTCLSCLKINLRYEFYPRIQWTWHQRIWPCRLAGPPGWAVWLAAERLVSNGHIHQSAWFGYGKGQSHTTGMPWQCHSGIHCLAWCISIIRNWWFRDYYGTIPQLYVLTAWCWRWNRWACARIDWRLWCSTLVRTAELVSSILYTQKKICNIGYLQSWRNGWVYLR